MRRKPTRSIDTATLEVMYIAVPARPEYVAVVRLALSGVCNVLRMDYDEIEDIKLAVSEACTNVVRYAYVGRDLSKERVTVRCLLRKNELEIVVEDQGKGFQPDQVRGFSAEKVSAGSMPKEGQLRMGIHVMKSLMDRVQIDSNTHGTKVHLYKCVDHEA